MSKIFGWMGNRRTQAHSYAEIECRSSEAGLRTLTLQNCVIGYTDVKQSTYHENADFIACIGEVKLKNKTSNEHLNELEVILAQYKRTGPQITHQLEGHYLLLIVLSQTGEVFIAQDRLGTIPIYYTKTDEGLFFGSDVSPFVEHLSLNNQISANAIYHYLYYHNIPSPLCIYDNFSRLMPGHYLIYQNEHVKTLGFWQPTYQNKSATSFEKKKAKLHQTFEKSIKDSLHQERVGTFLSGGIDSTSLLSLTTKIKGEPVDAFTIGFDVDNFDEVYFAKLAANANQSRHHIYYLQPKDITDCFDKLQHQLTQPFGNASIIPTLYCAKLAKENNISLLLAGDGGDELFGGNTRYAKQLLFSYYHVLPKAIRKMLLEPIFQKANSLTNLGLIRKILSYIEQANTPMPQRLETYNLLNRIGPNNLLHPHMANKINSHAPLQLLVYYYNQIDAKSVIGKMLGTDLKFTLTDSDLVKVKQACQLSHVDVAFPFLSDEMIDFSLTLSDKDKVHGKQLRYFFKRAMKNEIPKQIINKSKHGFGMPFGMWLLNDQHLRTFTFEHLHNLKHRTIIKQNFIEVLTKDLLHEHPNYYGVLCWILLMLEGWLQAHEKSKLPIQFKLKQRAAMPIEP